MYKIGELSKLCKISVKTLRYYDSEGLLIPNEIDKFTGYRYYSAAKLADCNRILALKELGFTLDEIKKQMNAKTPADILSLITAKVTEIKDAITQTESQLRRLEAVKQIITEGENNMFDIVIRSTDTLRVASIRRIYKTKEEALDEIVKIRSALAKNIVGNRNVIVNYETEYCESDFDLDACVEINGKIPKDCGCIEKAIEFPSNIATLICNKNELDGAYRAMTKQLEETPCQIIGAFYEIYHDDGTVELKVPVCRLSQNDDMHKNDEFDLRFENDEAVLGVWDFVDMVPNEEQFCPYKQKSHVGIWLHELIFFPKGEGYWAVSGWTKGCVMTSTCYPEVNYKNYYSIVNIDGSEYLFLRMKEYYFESRGGQPIVVVYKKRLSGEFSVKEFEIHDDVDLPFINDRNVLGNWKVCDFIEQIENFSPSKQNFPTDKLFFLRASFFENGASETEYAQKGEGKTQKLSWTKGILIHKQAELAEHYTIKTLDNREYLFIEWKNGDYKFDGRKPWYYVFVRG